MFVSADANHPAGFQDAGYGHCSGVYVGNGIVLTAGHCIAYMDDVQVAFGEEADDPEWLDVSPVCKAHSDGDWVFMNSPLESGWAYSGIDVAYCKLSSGHPTPPYSPVMVPNGCEAQYIRDKLFGDGSGPYGEAVEIVASGSESEPPAPLGTKRQAPANVVFEKYIEEAGEFEILNLLPEQEDGLQAETDPYTIWDGDSGGPVYFEMENGSWRTLGVIRHRLKLKPDLGDGLNQTFRLFAGLNSTPRHLGWIESNSLRDITPCHNWTGTEWSWVGGAGCGGEFDTSPDSSSSSWPGCSSGTVSTSTACSGWMPPGPDNKTSPSQADELLKFAINGPQVVSSNLLFGRNKLPQWIGTVGNDSYTSTTSESTEAFGGRGHDSLFVGVGADEVHGGTGNDLLVGGPQNDVLIGGRGLDYVHGDDGNDKIIIRGRCEIVAGETIHGGAGTDTLYTPVSLATLSALGVTVTSIEVVVINHPALHLATCESPPMMGPG